VRENSVHRKHVIYTWIKVYVGKECMPIVVQHIWKNQQKTTFVSEC